MCLVRIVCSDWSKLLSKALERKQRVLECVEKINFGFRMILKILEYD